LLWHSNNPGLGTVIVRNAFAQEPALPFISGLVTLLLFQGLGEVVHQAVLPAIPGPVIGMLGLLISLLIRGSIAPGLAVVAAGFSQHLGLLFVPAAAGVLLYLPQLRSSAWVVALALVSSTVLCIAVSAVVLRALGKDKA
jgi:holin-like protein